MHGVGLNPRRTGLLDVLERMGARVGVFNRAHASAASRSPTSRSRPAELVATKIERGRRCRASSTSCRCSRCSPRCARGKSDVRGAEELRVKESDRIETVVDGAARDRRARIAARATASRSRGVPTRPRGGRIDAGGDHRIAMLGAVAGLVSREGVRARGRRMRRR